MQDIYILHNSTRQLFFYYKTSFNEPLLAEDVSRIDDWLIKINHFRKG